MAPQLRRKRRRSRNPTRCAKKPCQRESNASQVTGETIALRRTPKESHRSSIRVPCVAKLLILRAQKAVEQYERIEQNPNQRDQRQKKRGWHIVNGLTSAGAAATRPYCNLD